MILKTLLRIFLTFPPPPTLDGKAPSEMVIRTVLVWSRIMYSSLIGWTAVFTSSTGLPILSAMSYQVLSTSSISSTFKVQE